MEDVRALTASSDFSLSESGTDIPIHDVTVDQYKYTSSIQSASSALKADERDVGISSPSLTRPRSQSLGCGQDMGASQIRSRLQHTVDFKTKGMKANTRGDYIQQPLATLKDLFHRVPDTVGFNIEISKSLYARHAKYLPKADNHQNTRGSTRLSTQA
jgi:glycerophosphodiester phosphodiesterase